MPMTEDVGPFEKANLTTAGLPVLRGAESILFVSENVTVYLSRSAGARDTCARGVTVYLTSQRLLYRERLAQQLNGVDLAAIQVLKDPLTDTCLNCAARRGSDAVLIRIGTKTVLRLRWPRRLKESKLFSRQLHSAIDSSERISGKKTSTAHGAMSSDLSAPPRPAGVLGVRTAEKRTHEDRKVLLSSAFVDINHLSDAAERLRKMSEALIEESKKVRLEKLNGDTEALLSAEFRDLMRFAERKARIGRRFAKSSSESEYYAHLARDFSDFLQPIVEKNGGLLSLLDAFVLYNSTRPIADMVSAGDLCDACALWPSLELSLRLDKIDSQFVVRSTETARVSQALIERVKEAGFMNAFEVAETFHIPLSVAQWQLTLAEHEGLLCRDEDGTGNIRFFPNEFDKVEKDRADSHTSAFLSLDNGSDAAYPHVANFRDQSKKSFRDLSNGLTELLSEATEHPPDRVTSEAH